MVGWGRTIWGPAFVKRRAREPTWMLPWFTLSSVWRSTCIWVKCFCKHMACLDYPGNPEQGRDQAIPKSWDFHCVNQENILEMMLVQCLHSTYVEIETQRKEKDLPTAVRFLVCLFHHSCIRTNQECWLKCILVSHSGFRRLDALEGHPGICILDSTPDDS